MNTSKYMEWRHNIVYLYIETHEPVPIIILVSFNQFIKQSGNCTKLCYCLLSSFPSEMEHETRRQIWSFGALERWKFWALSRWSIGTRANDFDWQWIVSSRGSCRCFDLSSSFSCAAGSRSAVFHEFTWNSQQWRKINDTADNNRRRWLSNTPPLTTSDLFESSVLNYYSIDSFKMLMSLLWWPTILTHDKFNFIVLNQILNQQYFTRAWTFCPKIIVKRY